MLALGYLSVMNTPGGIGIAVVAGSGHHWMPQLVTAGRWGALKVSANRCGLARVYGGRVRYITSWARRLFRVGAAVAFVPATWNPHLEPPTLTLTTPTASLPLDRSTIALHSSHFTLAKERLSASSRRLARS